MEPYEIVAAPVTLWIAPVGTEFPALDEMPGEAWMKVGSAGDLNYDEAGVTVRLPQTVDEWRSLGSTAPRKAWRSAEGAEAELILTDFSLEQYALALNNNAVTTTAAGVGQVGEKYIRLYRGLEVVRRALLLRGLFSAYDIAAGIGQYEIPVAVQVGSPEVVFTKANPVSYMLKWNAHEDPSAATAADRLGGLRMMTEDALT